MAAPPQIALTKLTEGIHRDNRPDIGGQLCAHHGQSA